MLSALLVATLLRMSSRDDEVTLAGRDHAQAAADQLPNLFEESDTARISDARSGSDQSRCHKLRALRRVRPIVRHHHERLMRRSCPGRTARADTVSLVVQLTGIADVFDAMRTALPLRVALPVTWAVEELRRALARDGRRAAPSPRFSTGSSVAD
jgi:hypothetical protein